MGPATSVSSSSRHGCILSCGHRHEREGRGLLDGWAEATADARWGVLCCGAQQYIVAMRSPLDDAVLAAVKAALRAHDGWLSSFVPDSSVLGIGPPAAAQAVRRVPGVLWVVRALAPAFLLSSLQHQACRGVDCEQECSLCCREPMSPNTS